MDGKAVFESATKVLPTAIEECLSMAELSCADIDHVIPHQPSVRILREISKKTNIPWNKFHTNMDRYANTAGASIPLVLDEVHKSQKLNRGDLILMIGVGSGWTWGAQILRW